MVSGVGPTAGVVERAFQLAPGCRTLEELRQKLREEGHTQVDDHLRGGALRADLRKLLER